MPLKQPQETKFCSVPANLMISWIWIADVTQVSDTIRTENEGNNYIVYYIPLQSTVYTFYLYLLHYLNIINKAHLGTPVLDMNTVHLNIHIIGKAGRYFFLLVLCVSLYPACI